MLRAGAMFSLPPTLSVLSALEHGHPGDMATSLGTATHSALSWRCSCGHGEGHLLGAGFNMMLTVSLSLVTKCPHPLMPRAGADGETQHLCLPLHGPCHDPWQVILAAGCQQLGMVLGMALCQCRACGMSLGDVPAGPAPAHRSPGFGEQGELGEWISCRA